MTMSDEYEKYDDVLDNAVSLLKANADIKTLCKSSDDSIRVYDNDAQIFAYNQFPGITVEIIDINPHETQPIGHVNKSIKTVIRGYVEVLDAATVGRQRLQLAGAIERTFTDNFTCNGVTWDTEWMGTKIRYHIDKTPEGDIGLFLGYCEVTFIFKALIQRFSS